MAKLNVNGRVVEVQAEDDTPLLWVIREQLGMTGTKYGCGVAQCGACTVHVDGKPTRSCQMQISALRPEQAITTIEGLSADPIGKKLQDAWTQLDVAQCGYCQAGQLMSATALLKAIPRPTDADIDREMAGNICRCATYLRIRAGIKQAAGMSSAAKEPTNG